MKKYVVKTDYNLGLMFDSKEVALEVLEATPVKSIMTFNNKSWFIDDREMHLFIIDDSKLSESEEN